MRNCDSCGARFFIYLDYQGQGICKSCFSKMTEKRIRSNIRNNKIINGKSILLLDDGSAAFAATRFIFDKITEAMPKLKVVFKKSPVKGFKKIICRSLEQECIDFMREILYKEKLEDFPNPTASIPQSELEKFCEIKNLSYKEHKYSQMDSHILKMLREISKMRPGAFFSLEKISEKMK